MVTIKKKNLSQVFSCKVCEIFKNTFFTEHIFYRAPTAAVNKIIYKPFGN